MLQTANDGFLFNLIAREAVKTFENQNFEAAGEGIRDQLAATWPATDARAPRDAVIGVNGDDLEVLDVSARPAHARLILNRGLPLFVRRVPGVDRGGAGHFVPS